MGWILLEALVALILAVFIVWFTMGGRRKPPSVPPGSGTPSDEASGVGSRKAVIAPCAPTVVAPDRRASSGGTREPALGDAIGAGVSAGRAAPTR